MKHITISPELFGNQLNYVINNIQTAMCKNGKIDLNIINAEISILLYQLQQYENNIPLTDIVKVINLLVELHKTLEQAVEKAGEYQQCM